VTNNVDNKPTEYPSHSAQLCYYRRVTWLELTMHGEVSSSK